MQGRTQGFAPTTLGIRFLILFPIFFALLCVGAARADAPPQEVRNMTLAEAVMLALRHSRTVESAYLDRLVQRFDLKVAQNKFLPDFSLSSSASQEDMGGESAHSTEIGGGAVLKVPTGGEFSLTWSRPVYTSQTEQWFDNFGNGVSLAFTQPLLKGGGLRVGRADQVLAAYQEESNLLNLQNTLIDTITDVVRAYRSFLLVQRELEINRLSLERAQELLERNKILIEEGRKAKVELIETEANVASQELSFMISRNEVDRERLELLKLLDIERHILIEPTESIEVEPVRLKEETLLQIALKNRPEYRQALLALKEAQTNLFLAEDAQQWQLDFSARYNITDSGEYTVDSSGETSDGAGDYSVSMELTIPFGDDSTKGELLSAKVGCRKAEIVLKELKENIEISVQNTCRDIDMQWKQVELSRKARDLSQKRLDVELEKFKNNKSDNFQVVSYQNGLIASELDENRTKIYYLNALTELDRYLGTTLEHWGIDPATVRKVELP